MSRRSIFSLLIVSLFLLISTTGCMTHDCGEGTGEDVEARVPLELMAAHEWGVFTQDYNDANFSLIGGPKPGMPPMPQISNTHVDTDACKPVIYFHGKGIGRVYVSVDMVAEDIITIPEARIKEDGISWNVEVAGEINPLLRGGRTIVMEEGVPYDYLFYEGVYQGLLEMRANLTRDEDDDLRFSINNSGPYLAEDVYFLYHPAKGEEKEGWTTTWKIPFLSSGEKTTHMKAMNQSNRNWDIRNRFKDNLLERGLTDEEAEDLLLYWLGGVKDEKGFQAKRTWFEPTENESASIIYFITRDRYDTLFPLEMRPMPEELARVGIIWITNIPVERA